MSDYLKCIPFLAEEGSTGLRHHSGYIDEEMHPDLQGPEGMRVLARMQRTSSLLGAFTLAVDALLRGVKWKTKPKKDSGTRGEQEARILEETLGDMENPWTNTVSEVMAMTTFGWSWLEDVYKIRKGSNPKIPQFDSKYADGRWGWRSLAPRAQESLVRWDITDNGRIKGWWQLTSQYKEVYLSAQKGLHFRTRSYKNNPEGWSLYQNAYIDHFYAQRLGGVESVGIERDLAGMPVMEVPPELLQEGATEAQKRVLAKWKKFITQIKRDELMGCVIPCETNPVTGKPTGYKLRLMTAGGRNPVDVNEVIKRRESRVLMSVLAEFLMVGLENVGSFSLHSDKTHLFAVSIGALLGILKDVMNTVAIPRLWRMNGVPPQFWPELEHDDIEQIPLTDLATFISTLVTAGVIVPDDDLEAFARERGKLPVKKPGMPEAQPKPTPAPEPEMKLAA